MHKSASMPTEKSKDGFHFVSMESRKAVAVVSRGKVHTLFDTENYKTKKETDDELGKKADQSSLYNLETKVTNMVGGTFLLGEKANVAAIRTIANPKRGDTWKALDTGHYWSYDGAGWNDIGEIIPGDVATKDEVNILANKLKDDLTTYDKYDLSKYIKELYITGIKDSDIISSRSFTISESSGRLILFISDKASLDFKIDSASPNTVYEATTISDPSYYGYIVLNPISEDAYSSQDYFLTFDNKKVSDLSFAPLTTAYLSKETKKQMSENTSSINKLTAKVAKVAKSDFIISGIATSVKRVNEFIAEIFIGNADPNSEFKIPTFNFNLIDKQYRFFIYENGVNIISTDQVKFDDIYWGKPIPLTFIDKSDKYGYVVFNKVDEGYAISNQNLILSNEKMLDIAFSPIILESTLKKNAKDIAQLIGDMPKHIFTRNTDWNLRIKELYLPGYKSDWRMRRLYIRKNQIRIFISDSSSSSNSNVVEFGYDNIGLEEYENIITLYKKGSAEIIGYCILEYYGNQDFVADSFIVFDVNVKDLEKSPKIKAMLKSEEQVVLIGDSLFGHDSSCNVLKDFLIKESGVRAYNMGFGGCRMSWRTNDDSNNYDKFTMVAVADAIESGDFSLMEEANTALSNMFGSRLADFKAIDWNKPTTIFCNYCNNDITGNTPIGELWKHTDTIESFDKSTLLGAMNYGIAKIITKYPHIKIVFFTEGWRYKADKDGNSVPPYDFVNSLGLTSHEYESKMKENCKRIGVSMWNFLEHGGRNNYNLSHILFDSSHFNYNGYRMFAKKIAAVFRLN